MPNKTYTVRVPSGAPDIGSEAVAQWLDSHSASPAELAPDPGAGERSLRLSLEREKVEQAARAAGEAEATFLRRLIATNAALSPQEEKQQHEHKDEAKPKPPVLKGKLSLRPDQVRPVVRAYESGQSLVLRRAFGVPQAVEAAAFTEAEREELSVSACEVLNRRAPRKLVENIDLVALASTVLAIESRKIEQVKAVAEQLRRERSQKPTARDNASEQNSTSTAIPQVKAAVRPRSFEKRETVTQEGQSLESEQDFI